MSERLWGILVDSFSKILLPGLTDHYPADCHLVHAGAHHRGGGGAGAVCPCARFVAAGPVLYLGSSAARPACWCSCSLCSTACPASASWIEPFPAGGVFSINEGAYCAETIRAALESVPKGQMEAGQCVGISHWASIRRIILPQALRTAFPTLASTLIAMVKDTSLATYITVTEMFMTTQRIVARSCSPRLYSGPGICWRTDAVFWLAGKTAGLFPAKGARLWHCWKLPVSASFGSTAVLREYRLTCKKVRRWPLSGSAAPVKQRLLRCLNFLEKSDTGSITVAGETLWSADDAPHPERTPCAAALRTRVPEFQPFSAVYGAAKCDAGGRTAGEERPDYKQNRKQIHDELEAHARELRWPRSGFPTGAGHYPTSFPAGSSSAWPLPAPWPCSRRSSAFDEPTSALDPELTGEVLPSCALAEHKTTMLVVTHEMDFARDVADRVRVHGKRAWWWSRTPSQEFFDHPQEARTRHCLQKISPTRNKTILF